MHPVATRLLALLETRHGEFAEFDKRVDKYQHSLQCATRASEVHEPDDYVVMCLFHDVFGGFHPLQHGNMAGAALQPFVSAGVARICFDHPYAVARYLRYQKKGLKFKVENEVDRFAVAYDIPSFDPAYLTLHVTFFHPFIERVFPWT